MARYVAFLRAINVGGRFIKMATLADHFRALGHEGVSTYINSGNVIFETRARRSDLLAMALETGLQPRLGFTSEAFVLTQAEVQAVAATAAAHHGAVGSDGEVNVFFLRDALTPAQQAAVLALRNGVDDFVPLERELLWLCRTRQSASKFSNAALERALKTRSTARRSSMLQGLAALLSARE
ncbi:MAG: DUF1697 domain-containing protein [Betaproteobacteria bacterium]|nr:DUF1697 domain-containing protein [Betaproteobacteria bacterium]